LFIDAGKSVAFHQVAEQRHPDILQARYEFVPIQEIVMSAIAATASSSGYSAVAQLLTSGLSNMASPSGTPQIGQTGNSSTAGTSSNNPTDTVDLSDRAKAVLAQAQKDQVLAGQLQELVQSNKNPSGSGKNSISGQSTQSPSTPGQAADNVMQEFDQLTGQTTAASTAQTADSKASSADGWGSIFPDAFVPTKSMSTSVTLGGFTVSVQSDPSRLYSEVAVSGNGVSTWSKHFWPSDMGGGGSASPPGISVSIGSNPNNSAEDIVTIAQNEATATSESASSTKGSATAAAVSARSSSITFVINYATGQITGSQSSETVSALSASQTLRV
jgi:hypothetical protein